MIPSYHALRAGINDDLVSMSIYDMLHGLFSSLGLKNESVPPGDSPPPTLATSVLDLVRTHSSETGARAAIRTLVDSVELRKINAFLRGQATDSDGMTTEFMIWFIQVVTADT